MKQLQSGKSWDMSRRGFLHMLGVTAAGVSLGGEGLFAAVSSARAIGRQKGTATVRGAFVYPPTESLRKVGYYSWPGSTFDAEGRQKEYMDTIKGIERSLGMRISMDEKPLDKASDTTRFIAEVKDRSPTGCS